MLIFIDESWQSSERDPKQKVGVLSAVAINSNDFNEYSRQIWNYKKKHLGPMCGNIETKGLQIFKKFLFRLEKKGVVSHQLSLARDILKYAYEHGAKAFASIVMDRTEVNLSCADDKQLERPFFFLFERINMFMMENHPELTAKLIFDDRGTGQNERISKSVSNFFHLSSVGKSFDRIIKVPFFAISTENVGIQIADIVGHLVAREAVQDKSVLEFWRLIKTFEYRSSTEVDVEGKKYHLLGFKIAKESKPK